MTRGQRNIRWIEQHCRIPEGKLVGQPVKLLPFQKAIIRGIYDKPTRRAIISVGRKNAKTATSAFLLLLHLCGPEARANSQLYSAAQSRDQAAILFGLAAKVVRMTELQQYVTVRDTAKQLFCAELGTLYRALSAEATTAYGLSPVFIVHDELGQVRGPRSELYEALETAVGAQEAPLSVVISTQAPNDTDLLSILIDDAKKSNDPRTRLFLWTAEPDADPFAKGTIRQANPAFGKFQNATEVMAMAEDARRMPSREAEYRNLVLNQRVETQAPFISPSVWKQCGAEPINDFEGLEVYAGLDLSEVNDLTAFVMIARHGGVWHVQPTFWLPGEGLRERARADRVAYDQWADEGYLQTTPGRSIEYEYIAHFLRSVFDRHDVRKLAFDRWNMRHLKPWLEKVGFREEELERLEDFGQGFQSMSPALRDLESALLQQKVAHGNHPVLMMCARNAVVEMDAAGGRKLSKKRSRQRGRIDGMVALAMAVSVAGTHAEEPEPEYQALFL